MDTEWFNRKINAIYGSQRKLAPMIVARSGKPMDQAALSRLLRGEREMTISEAVQLAKLLSVSVVEIIERAGVSVPRSLR